MRVSKYLEILTRLKIREVFLMSISFAAAFMRIYDKKIMSGEITFNELKLDKSLFNNLCIVKGFKFEQEETERLCDIMKVTDEERAMLLSYYE